MKVAKDKTGQEVVAAKEAPAKAICPYCEGVVVLRGRRVMGSNKKSYYWRHLDNEHRDCPGRVRSTR